MQNLKKLWPIPAEQWCYKEGHVPPADSLKRGGGIRMRLVLIVIFSILMGLTDQSNIIGNQCFFLHAYIMVLGFSHEFNFMPCIKYFKPCSSVEKSTSGNVVNIRYYRFPTRFL